MVLDNSAVVYSVVEKNGEVALESASSEIRLPSVFYAPIRDDLVNEIHTQVRCNKRQAHGVSKNAGVQVSALSWGTGRAVSRIPRVKGGGTHRSGQGAYGNMCRGGHTFNPLSTYRKWHRKVNLKQKRFAVASAIAASACPALVMARGHKIEKVQEVPLIIDDTCGIFEKADKTKMAVACMKTIGAYDDILRCKESRKLRPGKGKMRNRRYVMKKGPLLIHTKDSDSEFVKSFRNIMGLELMNVNRMNILKLAPGGHLGRFVIWTKAAIEKLSELFSADGTESNSVIVPKKIMKVCDVSRIVNSNAVQKVLRPLRPKVGKSIRKVNPFSNDKVMDTLNPYAKVLKKKSTLEHQAAQNKAITC